MRARTVAQEAGYTSPAPPNVPGSAKSGYPFSLDQYGTSHNLPAAASYDTNRYGTMRSQSRPGRLDLPPPYDSLDAAALEDAVVMVDYRTPSQNLRSPGQSPQVIRFFGPSVLVYTIVVFTDRPHPPVKTAPAGGSLLSNGFYVYCVMMAIDCCAFCISRRDVYG